VDGLVTPITVTVTLLDPLIATGTPIVSMLELAPGAGRVVLLPSFGTDATPLTRYEAALVGRASPDGASRVMVLVADGE
jgi:hypothetical protein